ncbi:MAG: hypothetical protein IJX77_00135 [Ruminococcus sp.]|nr:hypothetical protein [Ruminococcus sp.]
MSFFSKPTYKEVSLPFIHDCYSEEYAEYLEAGCIDIEAYGIIDGEQKYLYSSHFLKNPHMYDNGDYEQMIERLKDTAGKQVTVRLKYKGSRLVGFKILPESLAEVLGDERFLQLDEAAGWNISDTSCTEKGKA